MKKERKWTQKDDEWMRQLVQQEVEREADAIMQEVNADPNVRDAQAPPEIWDKLMAQIREKEAGKRDKI